MRLSHPLAALALAGCGARWELIDDTGAIDPGAPVITLSEPASGSKWSAADDIPVRAVVTDDAAPEALDVVIRSDVLGVVGAPSVASDGTIDTAVTLGQAGAHVLTITVTDPDGNEGAVSVGVTVEAGVSMEPVVTIEPSAPVTGDPLTCAHDPLLDDAGAAVPVSYTWTVDGVEVGIPVATLDGDLVVRGGVVGCTLILADDPGRSWDADPVVVGNALPTVGTPTITPSDPDETATLTCTPGEAVDPEGDAVTLATRWLVAGADVGTGETLGSDAFGRGDEVFCEVTPADPYGTGTPALSASVVIANNAPTAPTVAFVRGTVVPGAAAECVVTAEAIDIDGDPVSYSWTWAVNGVAVSETTASLDTTSLATGAVVACTATPDDGLSSGAPGSATLTLAAPTAGDLPASAAWIVVAGTSASGAFGKAVDAVSDLDGDGLPELLVSAPRGAGASNGALYLFTSGSLAAGADLVDTDADAWWIGHAADDGLGAARGAAGIGDFDGDGIGDLAGASPYNDDNGAAAGAAYVLYGGDAWTAGGDIDIDAPARFRGATGDWLGARMAGGDLDGDGLSDLVVTGPYNDLGGDKAGVAAVYAGDSSRHAGALDLADADALVTGSTAYDELGWSLDVGGDSDGDGYDDLVLGVFHDANGANAGAAAAISGDALGGTTSFLDVAYLVVHGLSADDRFGYDVAGVGDVDGDGLSDLLFGGYLADDGGADAGEARLFWGAAGMDRVVDADAADASFFGASAGEQAGSSLAPLGDWDDDGLADFLIGAPRTSGAGSAAGAAALYLGRDASTWGPTGAAGAVRFTGDAAGDWLADEISGELDVNGDGYSDLALGAQGADVGASAGGAVYVFTGP